MKASLFTRMNMVGISLSLLGALIIFQMARIQTSASGKALEEEARLNYESRTEIIYPERGNIYDRWGNLLAGNREVYEVGLNLIDIENPETIASDVSTILGLDYAEVSEKVNLDFIKGEQEYIPLAKFVESEKIALLEDKRDEYDTQMLSRARAGVENLPSLDGVEWRPHLQRTYPEKTLASNIVGFYSFMEQELGTPHFGVEEFYNDLLAGTPVEVTYYYDPNKTTDIPTVAPGASLILTIDREMQAKVEEIADRAVESTGSESATILVMDPKTGEMLAMATTPRLDPNEYWKFGDIFPGSTPFNRAIGQTYEPGSVFKVLTMAAAMDTGTVTPDTPFLDTGVFNYGGYNIYNWDRGAWGPQTMLGCMQHSLNVCLSSVAVDVGASDFYDYLKAFGIGHRTNIDLAGEVNFPLAVPGDKTWFDINLATNSFGQGLATTPTQMIMAVSALANNGKMMAPHVLKSVIDEGFQRDITPTVVGQPIQAETARQITEMLAISLEEEASNALVEGYRVAGKTGTGEIPSEEGYTTNLTNASFVGWGPADDPSFIIYVWLEKPTSSPWGSIVAAPIFAEVASEIVVLMDLPPDAIRQQLYASATQ
jgi:cell division protein FtsI/penicillin-binding protein 2